jgi:hypothetical protein
MMLGDLDIQVPLDAANGVDHHLSVLETLFLLRLLDAELSPVPEADRTFEQRYAARLRESMQINLDIARRTAREGK